MNPGDLDWGPLEGLGPCTIHDRTPAEQLYERSRDADAVITNKVPYDRELMGRLPRLRYVGVSATGYNVVDLDAARERGIPVTNVPGYGTDSVVQATLAHILALARRVEYHSETVRAGKWSQGEDFCYWDYPQVELTGRTLGQEIEAARPGWPQDIVRPIDDPLYLEGGLAVLRGNLAPGGAIIKQSGASADLMVHTGRAVVFESLADLAARVDDPDLEVSADDVLVLRNAGPRGAPGMPEAGYIPIPR
ncbi:MAG: dihydroxy-acid dehydratase, partial [Planctomycetes bacterium]|nr:dihydroxy-acid dehydratase [Planctomycetota bacterium]